MEREDALQGLVQTVDALSDQLDPAQHGILKGEIARLRTFRIRSAYRIALFGPFNYGKSTLLNALLGRRDLPVDLVPTTGAAIRVQYGADLRSCIRLRDGSVICETGTELLKHYAILDEQRHMREDVVGVEVSCPHPFLQQGIELLDLPGTDDQERQDQLVQEQLLKANLILQVLDGRKLMTLGEREQLRDWLQDRGIETVVFVVNFLNLMEEDDQKQVSNRMRFVAESFRSRLPEGVANLYRVDALPALRAQLQGDDLALQDSGLPELTSALQTIFAAYQDDRPALEIPRLTAVAHQAMAVLEDRIGKLEQQIEADEQRHTREREIKQRAQSLIQRGFEQSVRDLRQWLELPGLLNRYQPAAKRALQDLDFENWSKLSLELEWNEHRQQICSWVDKAASVFKLEKPATTLELYRPDPPRVDVPPPPQSVKQNRDGTPVALAAGLGWLFGGPVGAAVLGGASYLINQADTSESSRQEISTEQYEQELEQVFDQAATQFLSQFSDQGLSALDRYVEVVDELIHPLLETTVADLSEQQFQLDQTENQRQDLQQALHRVETLPELA